MVQWYTSWWRGSSKHLIVGAFSGAEAAWVLGISTPYFQTPRPRIFNEMQNALVLLQSGSFSSQARNARAVGRVLDTSSQWGFLKHGLQLHNPPPIFFNRLCFKNPLKVSAIPSLQLFLPHFVLSIQLPVMVLGYSTLRTASCFNDDLLYLSLLVQGGSDCPLDNCQVSSPPVIVWTRLKTLQVLWVTSIERSQPRAITQKRERI